MYSLRPYQQEAVDAIFAEWYAGHRRTLLVLPTGCGKTICFAAVAEECVNQGERVLILAHRGELLEQAADKLKAACGLETVLEKAESSALGSSVPVTVGSVQSMMQPKRLEQFPEDYYDVIIVDEAHHCLSDSYQRVLEHFPDADVLGVTATADRGDKRNLGTYFDSVAYEYGMANAIKNGYLCLIKAQMIPLELDINSVSVSNGDYAVGEIGNALEPYLEQIAQEMTNYCRGRKTVVFLPLIATSQKFCAMLQDVGFRAAEVNGNSTDRAEVLADFDSGRYDVLCNSMLLTEGWDCPSVDCIVVLRPTKVRGLYCLDEETEILTRDGWKKDVSVGEEVAAFDMETGEIKFTPAIAKVRRPLNEDECFYSIKGPSADIRVTDRHRMIHKTKRAGSKWQISEARDVAALRDGARIPVCGHSNFPGVPLTDDELRFIGWVMTDGNINKSNNAVSITQSSTQPWLEEIQKCIDGCGFKYRRFVQNPKSNFRRNGNNICWTISKGKPRGRDKHLRGWGALEPYLSKDMSPALNDMTERQFDVMLEAIVLGDGSKQTGQGWTQRSYHITKGNKHFIEALQIMGIQRGYRASVTEHVNTNGNLIWTIHMKKQDFVRVGSKYDTRPTWQEEPHGVGNCWCVQNDIGTLVARRNGKVAIVGNCQMVGRGTRPCDGKKDLLILDFLWMTTRHDLCKPSCLVSKSAEVAEKVNEMVADDDQAIDLLEADEEAQADVVAERERALAAQLAEMRRKKKRQVDPIQYAYSIAAEDLSDYEPTFAWEMEPPSQKQLDLLENRGINSDMVPNKGMATILIDKLIARQKAGLPTPKQINTLERFGFRHVGEWQFTEASNMLTWLAKKKWRLPWDYRPGSYIPQSLKGTYNGREW